MQNRHKIEMYNLPARKILADLHAFETEYKT